MNRFRVAVYLNPESSEVTAEYDTLVHALATHQPDYGVSIMNNGRILAYCPSVTKWTITQYGREEMAELAGNVNLTVKPVRLVGGNSEV
jgi:hypothetical protein